MICVTIGANAVDFFLVFTFTFYLCVHLVYDFIAMQITTDRETDGRTVIDRMDRRTNNGLA